MSASKISAALVLIVILGGAGFLFMHKDAASGAPVFQPNETMAQATMTASSSQPLVPVCTNEPDSFDCYKKHYQSLVDAKGVEAAFADLKARYASNSYVVAQCHPLSHVIGKEAAGHYASVSEAYKHGDSFCWSGYYHGILEGVIAKIGAQNLPTKLNGICSDISGKDRYSFDYYNCVHGLGHGIMELESDDVPVSLKVCDNLTGSWEQQSCWSGVFMENIIANLRDGSSQYLKKSDPLYPCDSIEDKYKGTCYLGQTSYALQVNDYNFAKVFALCTTVAQPYRDICNQSMGRDSAGSSNDIPVQTKAKCDLATDANDRKNCVVGAVKDIISYFHGTKEAGQFCALLSSDDKRVCTDTAAAYFAAFK